MTPLRKLPRLFAALEDQLASSDPVWDGFDLSSFLRVASWIGGDRNGNPDVAAEVLRKAVGRPLIRL
jgi:phosphoenolpyruvate carboxylase